MQLSEWINSKNQKTPNIGEDIELQEFNSLTAIGIQNDTSTLQIYYEVKYRLPTIQCSNCIPNYPNALKTWKPSHKCLEQLYS